MTSSSSRFWFIAIVLVGLMGESPFLLQVSAAEDSTFVCHALKNGVYKVRAFATFFRYMYLLTDHGHFLAMDRDNLNVSPDNAVLNIPATAKLYKVPAGIKSYKAKPHEWFVFFVKSPEDYGPFLAKLKRKSTLKLMSIAMNSNDQGFTGDVKADDITIKNVNKDQLGTLVSLDYSLSKYVSDKANYNYQFAAFVGGGSKQLRLINHFGDNPNDVSFQVHERMREIEPQATAGFITCGKILEGGRFGTGPTLFLFLNNGKYAMSHYEGACRQIDDPPNVKPNGEPKLDLDIGGFFTCPAMANPPTTSSTTTTSSPVEPTKEPDEADEKKKKAPISSGSGESVSDADDADDYFCYKGCGPSADDLANIKQTLYGKCGIVVLALLALFFGFLKKRRQWKEAKLLEFYQDYDLDFKSRLDRDNSRRGGLGGVDDSRRLDQLVNSSGGGSSSKASSDGKDSKSSYSSAKTTDSLKSGIYTPHSDFSGSFAANASSTAKSGNKPSSRKATVKPSRKPSKKSSAKDSDKK